MGRWLTLGVLAASAMPAFGTGGSLYNGGVVLSYGVAHWTETQSASLSGSEADPESSSLYQTGWWYRFEGQTREYPLPPPDTETYSGSAGSAVWNDLGGFGLEVHEDFSVVDNGGPSATYHSDLYIESHAASDLGLTLIHYLDADAGGTFANDTGVFAARDLIRFLDGSHSVRYEARSEAAGPVSPPDAFAAGSASALKGRLTNAFAEQLDNDGLPFGPGNMAAAYEWHGFVAPGGGWGRLHVTVAVNAPADLVKGDGLIGEGWRNNYSDILFQNTSDHQLAIWDLEGTRRVTGAGFYAPPGAVAVDDFNGDRLSDIVFQDPVTGQVSFHFLAADIVPLDGAAPLPLNWRLAASADFDHDGKTDILWRNTTSQRLVVWAMNGITRASALAPSPNFAVDANWEVVGASDMNGDGNADLVWYNVTSGRCVIWYLDGALARTSAGFTTPMGAADANWRIVALGDWGKGSGAERPAVYAATDLLWRNSTSGRLVVWHMNLAGQRTSGVFTSPDAYPLDFEVVGPR